MCSGGGAMIEILWEGSNWYYAVGPQREKIDLGYCEIEEELKQAALRCQQRGDK